MNKIEQLEIHIIEPKIQIVEKTNLPGAYLQSNKVYRSKMTFAQFSKLANSEKYREPPSENYIDLNRQYLASLKTNHMPIYADGFEKSLFETSCKEFNLNNLGDLLCDLESNKYPGITSPFLYIGMWRTSFGWHTEDKDLYSVNFLHFGKPKTWFFVPPAFAKQLEELLAKEHEACPQHLRHKMTIIDPDTLRRYGIPVFETVQEAGQFIITFPYGYHAGYNHGLNCAEAVNFATESWVKFGVCAAECGLECEFRPEYMIDMEPFVKKYLKSNIYEPFPIYYLRIRSKYKNTQEKCTFFGFVVRSKSYKFHPYTLYAGTSETNLYTLDQIFKWNVKAKENALLCG